MRCDLGKSGVTKHHFEKWIKIVRKLVGLLHNSIDSSISFDYDFVCECHRYRIQRELEIAHFGLKMRPKI